MVVVFLCSLFGGMLAVLATGRQDLIAWRFMRNTTAISFGLSVGVAVWLIQQQGAWPTGSGRWVHGLIYAAALISAGLVVLAPMASRISRTYSSLLALGGLGGIATACQLLWTAQSPGDRIGAAILLLVGQVLGAWLLGSITVAWLLGHAYLTATKMTIAPLRHFSRMLSFSVIARAAFVVVSLLVAVVLSSGSDVRFARIFGALQNEWLVASLRLGVGIVGVGVFAYMVRDCVRLRATQSATGILYFGSLFAYIGELAAIHLSRELGWPI